jgi:acid phosphatase (class A)
MRVMRQTILALLVAAASAAAQPSYLSGAPGLDMTEVLPSPPKIGTPRYEDDRAIFKMTRAFKGSPRWELAINDAKLTITALLADFRCALGINLTQANAPRTGVLLSGVLRAGGAAIGPPKQKFERERPYLIDPVSDDEICTAKLPDFDYPSGHTTIGWAIGLVLAEAEPGRATAILRRARAFGQSRVVCGVHNASAIEAGFIAGSAVVAALQDSAAFRSDFDAARTELEALRGRPESRLEGTACEAEDELLAVRPY